MPGTTRELFSFAASRPCGLSLLPPHKNPIQPNHWSEEAATSSMADSNTQDPPAAPPTRTTTPMSEALLNEKVRYTGEDKTVTGRRA